MNKVLTVLAWTGGLGLIVGGLWTANYTAAAFGVMLTFQNAYVHITHKVIEMYQQIIVDQDAFIAELMKNDLTNK